MAFYLPVFGPIAIFGESNIEQSISEVVSQTLLFSKGNKHFVGESYLDFVVRLRSRVVFS